MGDLIKVTGLWKKEPKDGKDGAFYQGRIGIGANVLIFKNKFKRGENDPDLILYVGKATEPKAEAAREKFPDEEIPDSEIPF